MKSLMLFIILGSFFGCASAKLTTPFSLASEKNGKAVIYIYRINSAVRSMDPDIPKVVVNDQVIGPLNLGGYYKQEVEPGTVELTWKNAVDLFPNQKISAKVEANHDYFVKFEIGIIEHFFGFVSKETGLNEIRNTNLLVP